MWNYLKKAHFNSLEKCFTTYLKRCLRLPKTARNRYTYIIAGVPHPIVEVIRLQLKTAPTSEFTQFIEQWRAKIEEAAQELEGDAVLAARESWSGPLSMKRHVSTRYLAHGYHHHLCQRPLFHHIDPRCLCKYCGQPCRRDHALTCHQAPPLGVLANM